MTGPPSPITERVRHFLDLMDSVGELHRSGTPASTVVEKVMSALLAIPRPIRSALGLRQRISVALDPYYNAIGSDRYPRLAANWDCGPTALLDAVDHLVAATLARDHIAILGALDEIHVLVAADLVSQCEIHVAGCHETDAIV